MFINKYGTKNVVLGLHDPYPFQCPHCKELGAVNFVLYGLYYHYWYIPIFPYEKDGYARCSNCEFKIDSIKYNRLTKDIFKSIKNKYRHPFYCYTGLALFLAPLIIALIALLFF